MVQEAYFTLKLFRNLKFTIIMACLSLTSWGLWWTLLPWYSSQVYFFGCYSMIFLICIYTLNNLTKWHVWKTMSFFFLLQHGSYILVGYDNKKLLLKEYYWKLYRSHFTKKICCYLDVSHIRIQHILAENKTYKKVWNYSFNSLLRSQQLISVKEMNAVRF